MPALRLLAAGFAISAAAAGEPVYDPASPWPAPVPGHVQPAAGEHPRLFFRRADLDRIRQRAATPEGQAIVRRLRELLGGGEAMPPGYNISPRAYTGNRFTDLAGIEIVLAERPAPAPEGVDDDDDGKQGGGKPSAKAPAGKKGAAPSPAPAPPPATDEADGGELVLDADGAKPKPPPKPTAQILRGIPAGAYTISHVAGFGMLWQLTGDKRYADLGRRCMELSLRGVRDRDDRYAWANPGGALRAGPSLGWHAVGYDLCYDGWDEEFRTKVAQAIAAYDWGADQSLAALARGARMHPKSNHWGGQIGGAALALLAIRGDPGIDAARIDALLADNRERMLQQLNQGLGDGGYFWEGAGPGGIATDTAFIPALQAWRVAGGWDFSSPRRNVSYLTMCRIHELTTMDGLPWYHCRHPSSYGTGFFGPRDAPRPGKPGQVFQSDRAGLSRAGQFAQGFGTVRDEYKPAMLWTYESIVEPDPAARTYDTVSPYPHRAVLSLINWPIGMQARNPGEILPKVLIDERHRHYLFRNRWRDRTDCYVSFVSLSRDNWKGVEPVVIWGHDLQSGFGKLGMWGTVELSGGADGPWSLSYPKAETHFAIDFSGLSGADCLVAGIGPGAACTPYAKTSASGAVQNYSVIEAGGRSWTIATLGPGAAPAVTADGEAVAVGKRRLRFDGARVALE